MYVREPTYVVSYMFKRILVPIDGSSHSIKALDVALDFAKRYGSVITAFIVDDGNIGPIEKVREVVESISRKAGVSIEFKIAKLDPTTSISTAIVEEVSRGGYDLVVVSARGRTVNPELIIGSVTLSVVVNVPVSVFVVR
ncbi:MAG: universal stress protein [Sulfolobales archaeon]|nr:universal stress protein [Sulfolobales archaeon]